MGTITVPLTGKQEAFIKDLVKSGRAANKAHAMRMAIDTLAAEEALRMIRLGHQEIIEGKTLKGNLNELAAMID